MAQSYLQYKDLFGFNFPPSSDTTAPVRSIVINGENRAAENQAQPKWLNNNDVACIKAIYTKAKEYTELTGIKFHVDHIIPLRGKNVSGLHIPGNLRITTQTINQSKGNSFNIGDL